MRSSVTRSIFPFILLAGVLLHHVTALPRAEPKSAWVRKGHGRRAMKDMLAGRAVRTRSDLPRASCPETAAKSITAPKQIVWVEFTDVDAAAGGAGRGARPARGRAGAGGAAGGD